jgi:UDPglucose 6-dehydrogenase
VLCVDIDEQRVTTARKIPIYEPLRPVRRNVQSCRLSFAPGGCPVRRSGSYFIAVGTPPGKDGAADLSAAGGCRVHAVAEAGAVAMKSTVPVAGDEAAARQVVDSARGRLNPEFLKEVRRSRTSSTPRSGRRHVPAHARALRALLRGERMVITDPRSSELTKTPRTPRSRCARRS